MTSTPTRPAPTGTEIMLRSLGLDGVITAAKELANAGSVARIMAFANDAEELARNVRTLNARLARVETLAGLIAERVGVAPELVATLLELKPDPGPGPCAGPGSDPGEPASGMVAGSDPGQPRAA